MEAQMNKAKCYKLSKVFYDDEHTVFDILGRNVEKTFESIAKQT